MFRMYFPYTSLFLLSITFIRSSSRSLYFLLFLTVSFWKRYVAAGINIMLTAAKEKTNKVELLNMKKRKSVLC